MIGQSSSNIQEQELSRSLEKTFVSYFLSDVRKSVPKINFKKIRLNKFQDLSNKLFKENITRVTLDDRDRKSTRLNSSHSAKSRMPSSA